VSENSLSKNYPDESYQALSDQAIISGEADLILEKVADLSFPLISPLMVIALLEEDIYRIETEAPFNDNGGIEQKPQDINSSTVLTTPIKEQLAIIAHANKPELKALFEKIDIRNRFGKITLVGFGPGNPDLLTLGGDKALTLSDIIFHDDLLDKEYLKKYSAEKVYVGKRKGSHCVEQDEINRLILAAAKDGKQVVRLKGGDPMIFAHGGEEVLYLERNFVKVEVIPGVSSGIAVASLLKIPLTHRGLSSSMAFISGHSKNVHLPDADTLIIYMGGSNIGAIARKAIEQGRNPQLPVLLVHNLSLPDQQEFFFTLDELTYTAQIFPTPIIIVIGEVVSFRNKKNVELQKTNHLDTFANKISFNELGSGLEKLKTFDWLIFSNCLSVSLFFDFLENSGKDSRFLQGIKIAAIGNNSARTLREHGILADLIAQRDSSVGLLSRMKELRITPSNVLITGNTPISQFLLQSLKELGCVAVQLILDQSSCIKNLSPLVTSNNKTIRPSASSYQTPAIEKITIS
jgi:uroporphyrinogen III methyltransferase/synthase